MLIDAGAKVDAKDEVCLPAPPSTPELLMRRSWLLVYAALYRPTSSPYLAIVTYAPVYSCYVPCKQYGATPLFVACQKAHADIVEVLLVAGAGRAMEDRFGETAVEQVPSGPQGAAVKAVFDSVAQAVVLPALARLPRPFFLLALAYLDRR